MFFDLQTGSMMKRISAWLLDIILLAVFASGFAFLVSDATKYDAKYDQLLARYQYFGEEYGIDVDISDEDYAKLSAEELQKYTEVSKLMDEDAELNRLYSLIMNLTFVIISLGILLAYLLLELVVPLFLKNGQTIGKKIFGLCLMQLEHTKVKPISLAVRAFLGKYAIETMVPVLICIMIYFGTIGIVGPIILGLLLLLQLVVLYVTKTNSAIHDLLAGTVVVDAKSQMIFENLEAKEAYKKKIEENTNEKGYV